jgi:hypothetical protein
MGLVSREQYDHKQPLARHHRAREPEIEAAGAQVICGRVSIKRRSTRVHAANANQEWTA